MGNRSGSGPRLRFHDLSDLSPGRLPLTKYRYDNDQLVHPKRRLFFHLFSINSVFHDDGNTCNGGIARNF